MRYNKSWNFTFQVILTIFFVFTLVNSALSDEILLLQKNSELTRLSITTGITKQVIKVGSDYSFVENSKFCEYSNIVMVMLNNGRWYLYNIQNNNIDETNTAEFLNGYCSSERDRVYFEGSSNIVQKSSIKGITYCKTSFNDLSGKFADKEIPLILSGQRVFELEAGIGGIFRGNQLLFPIGDVISQIELEQSTYQEGNKKYAWCKYWSQNLSVFSVGIEDGNTIYTILTNTDEVTKFQTSKNLGVYIGNNGTLLMQECISMTLGENVGRCVPTGRWLVKYKDQKQIYDFDLNDSDSRAFDISSNKILWSPDPERLQLSKFENNQIGDTIWTRKIDISRVRGHHTYNDNTIIWARFIQNEDTMSDPEVEKPNPNEPTLNLQSKEERP